MTSLLAVHITGGILALVAGVVATGARKGGRLHARAGTVFVAAMLVLGVTASAIEMLKSSPGSPIGGIAVCYFIATSWVAAQRRDGTTGRFEIIACAGIFSVAALMVRDGINGATTPAGVGPIFALAGLCAAAGLLDLNAILRQALTPAQRLSRHLWRMCCAFFMATGSFFLGQQAVLPKVMQGSAGLYILAFAPFAVMVYWLARLRFAKALARFRVRIPAIIGGSVSQPTG